MPPKKRNTRATKANQIEKREYTSPKKSLKTKHPGTPSTVSTNVSSISSIKSHKSNGTTKSIEVVYNKLNFDSDDQDEIETGSKDGKECEDEESEVTAFDVLDIEFEKLKSLVNAANHMFPLAKRQELVGSTHREYITAILDSQTLAICKQLYQLVAVKLGNREFKDTMKEVAQFGNKSKHIIVNKIMHHVTKFNLTHIFVKNDEVDSDDIEDEIISIKQENNEIDEDDNGVDFDTGMMKGTKTPESEEDDDLVEEENVEYESNEEEEESDEENEDEESEENGNYEKMKKMETKYNSNSQGVSVKSNAKSGKLNKKKHTLKTLENEEDGSDVDPFGGELVFSASLIKTSAVRGESGGMSFYISQGVKVIGSNTTVHVGIFDLSGPAFFLKSDFIKLGMEHIKKKKVLFQKNHIDPEMKWIDTIKNCPRRIAHSIGDEIMRTNKGNAQQIIYFVMEVGNSKKSVSIKQLVESVINDFKKCFKIYNSPGYVGIGTSFLTFLMEIGNQGLHSFFLKKYSDGLNSEPAADSITSVFDSVFNEPGLQTFWNVNLDKFLPNFEIKQILMNHAHVSGWNALPDSDKEACFHNSIKDSSRLPVWNNMIMRQTY